MVAALLPLLGCAGPPPLGGVAAGRGTLTADTVTVVDHGWHTDIGFPASELSGPAVAFARAFPGARSLLFGFGKRTFFTARVDSWREYLLGPIPGPAAILVTGLSVTPEAAYRPTATVVLRLPPGGAAALSGFLWRSFARDITGRPRLIARGPDAGSLFYAAKATYSLGYTCNAWTADALRAAGTGLTPAGVVFAGQVMRRARRAAVWAGPPASPLATGH
jgi:hypothetical protein